MAQILKEEVRERILSSAREEFLSKDYESASMRSIALKSRMTVGNLYRYFKSKEELNLFIVSPTYNKINDLILQLTDSKISLRELNGPLNLKVEDLKRMLDQLGDGLADIYLEHKIEFKILMMHSRINQTIRGWFAGAIEDLILTRFPTVEKTPNLSLISTAYATAVFDGLKEIFVEDTIGREDLKQLVKVYLDSYIQLLEKMDLNDMK